MLDVPSPSTVIGPARERGQGKEVAGGRCVGLDGVVATLIAGGPDVEAAELAVVDRHSECLHHRERHGDVRLRDEDALNFDRRSICEAHGNGHQEAHSKTGSRCLPLTKTSLPTKSRGLDGHRRTARIEVGSAVGPEAVEHDQQVGRSAVAACAGCRRDGRFPVPVASMAVRKRRLVPEFAT